jgi:predicted double-glycine peptidase
MSIAEAPLNIRSRAARVLLPATIALPLLCASAWFFFVQTARPHLNHVPMTRQSTPYTCGAAALQSVFAYYGEDYREVQLSQELKSDPEQGTDYHEIVRFARSKGLQVEPREGLSIDDLRRAVDQDLPVIVAFQAWGDNPGKYVDDWDDGHYAIVIGVDNQKVYLMDPSTIGDYTFILIPEFLSRWHDAYLNAEHQNVKLVHFGMIFRSPKKSTYDPEELLPLK